MEVKTYISTIDKIVAAWTSMDQLVSNIETSRRKKRQDTEGLQSVVAQFTAFRDNIQATRRRLLLTRGAKITQTEGISPPSFRADERS